MKAKRVWQIDIGLASIFLALCCGMALGQAPTSMQQGLPPELVIPKVPSLLEQARDLQQIIETSQPQTRSSGLLSALKAMFSPRPRNIVIAATDLWDHAEELRGSQVEVHGIIVADENRLAFATAKGRIVIDLGGGARPTGFPRKTLSWMPAKATGLVEMPFNEPVLRVTTVEPSAPLACLRLARVLEEQGNYHEAVKAYDRAANELRRAQLPWAAFAATQAGWVAYHRLRDPHSANSHLYSAWSMFAVLGKDGKPLFETWIPNADGAGWKLVPVADAVGPLLDTLGRESFWYRLVDFFVTLGAGSKALGLVLLALVTRLGIHPLTRKQLASMEAMRKLQPQIKALQEEFKDDKQRFQQEIWKLWQENGVNPFGGCWPMLIQMPILIFVYQGIRRYIVRFAESNFLWIRNLAMPDLPLLVAYTASMVVFQKIANRMQPMPADEKQQQQQQMMTWMMPLMFFFFFRTLPSAFILYWLASNLFYFGEQWLFRRHVEREEAMKGVPVAPRRKRSFLMDVMSRAARQTGARSQSGDTSASAMGGPKNNHKQRPTQRKHRRKRK